MNRNCFLLFIFFSFWRPGFSAPDSKSFSNPGYGSFAAAYRWILKEGPYNNSICLEREQFSIDARDVNNSFHYVANHILHSTLKNYTTTEATGWKEFLKNGEYTYKIKNKTILKTKHSPITRTDNQHFKSRVTGYYNHIDKRSGGWKAPLKVKNIPTNTKTLQVIQTLNETWGVSRRNDFRDYFRFNQNPAKRYGDLYQVPLFSGQSSRLLDGELGFVSSTFENLIAWWDAFNSSNTQNEEIYRHCLDWMALSAHPTAKSVPLKNLNEGQSGKLTTNAKLENQIVCGGFALDINDFVFTIKSLEKIENQTAKALLLLYMLGEPISALELKQSNSTIGSTNQYIPNRFVSFIKLLNANGSLFFGKDQYYLSFYNRTLELDRNGNQRMVSLPYTKDFFGHLRQELARQGIAYVGDDCWDSSKIARRSLPFSNDTKTPIGDLPKKPPGPINRPPSGNLPKAKDLKCGSGYEYRTPLKLKGAWSFRKDINYTLGLNLKYGDSAYKNLYRKFILKNKLSASNPNVSGSKKYCFPNKLR